MPRDSQIGRAWVDHGTYRFRQESGIDRGRSGHVLRHRSLRRLPLLACAAVSNSSLCVAGFAWNGLEVRRHEEDIEEAEASNLKECDNVPSRRQTTSRRKPPMEHPTLSIHAPECVFVDGKWTPPQGRDRLSVISPVTEEEIMTFPDGTPGDMDRAVASARAAFDTGPWPRLSAQERGAMLMKVAAVLQRRLPELADVWTAQVGAPISLTKYASTQAPGLFEFYGKMIQTYPIVDERKRDDGKIARVVNEPVGVVAAITPWNAPMVLLCYKAAAALAAGCTVVSKPAPETPMDAY